MTRAEYAQLTDAEIEARIEELEQVLADRRAQRLPRFSEKSPRVFVSTREVSE